MASKPPNDPPAIDDLLTKGYFKNNRAYRSASPNVSTPSEHIAIDPESSRSRSHSGRGIPSTSPYDVSSTSAQSNTPRRLPDHRSSTNNEHKSSGAYYTGAHPNMNRFRRSTRGETWPPRPTVEDESAAVVGETSTHASDIATSSTSETPARGTVDQCPIILEAEVSAENAAILHDKLQGDTSDDSNAEERRFVLVSDPHPSASSLDPESGRHRRPRRTSTAPEPTRPSDFYKAGDDKRSNSASQQGEKIHDIKVQGKRGLERPVKETEVSSAIDDRQPAEYRLVNPSSAKDEPGRKISSSVQPERHGNRADMPTLQTEQVRRPPTSERSSSTYAYTPDSEPPRHKRVSSSSTEYVPASARSYNAQHPTREYSNTTAPVRTHHGSAAKLETPVVEKRRSGNYTPGTYTPNNYTSGSSPAISRSSTPNSEKRWSAGEESSRHYGKQTRIPKVSSDGLHPLRQTDHSEHKYAPHTSKHLNTESSSEYLLSSDDDLDDSSDSERRKRRHHRRKHSHNPSSLHPTDGTSRRRSPSHHRSSSHRRSRSHHRSSSKDPRASVDMDTLPPRAVSPRGSYKDAPRGSVNRSSADMARGGTKDTRGASGRFNASTAPYADDKSSTLRPAATDGRTRAPSPAPPPSFLRASLPSASVPTSAQAQYTRELRRGPIPLYGDEVDPRSSTAGRPIEKPVSPVTLATKSSGTPQWPPKFQPEESSSERTVGSYRRYSEDVQDGTIAPLPLCPRTTPVRGYTDWLTIPNCPIFDICPSCFNSSVAKTPYAAQFVPAIRSPNEDIICDFGSQPWYRIAWLLSRKDRRPDLTLVRAIANIAVAELPCLGKHEAIRKWYSILDPATGAPVRNFDICGACTKSIESLLPSLKGIFVRTDTAGPPNLHRICDMRFDSKRFIHYFDALELLSEAKPHPRRGLDTKDFVGLAKRFAVVGECPGSETMQNACWWAITQLPEFTVCEECFEEVIRPEAMKKRAIPNMFMRKSMVPGPGSCQLYSDRMKEIFLQASDGNDYKYLVAKARERKAWEAKYKEEREQLSRLVRDGRPGTRDAVVSLEREWKKWE